MFELIAAEYFMVVIPPLANSKAKSAAAVGFVSNILMSRKFGKQLRQVLGINSTTSILDLHGIKAKDYLARLKYQHYELTCEKNVNVPALVDRNVYH